jgi:hypothetical protein
MIRPTWENLSQFVIGDIPDFDEVKRYIIEKTKEEYF